MAFRILKRSLSGLLIGALLLALGGCNKLRLGYEYADWLVIYSVEDNFDLEKSQRGRFKDDVESYFRWHRKAMLPLYADLLSDAADSLGKGLRPEGVDTALYQVRNLFRRTMEPTVDKAVDLLVSLTPAQVDQWHEKQQKKTQKLRKDFSGSLDEQLERRYEKIVDELEDWTGKLGKDQRKQVRALNRTLPWNGHLWLENRERVQGRLAALLKRKASREEVRKLIGDYFLHPEKLRSEEYAARIRESEAKTRIMVGRIHGILTPQQRRIFRTRMEKLAEEFRKMSRMDG